MLGFVLQKVVRNAWKVLCLLVGSVLIVAVAGCIPIYTTGILQRMLVKDFENSQISSGVYPGYLAATGTYASLADAEVGRAMERLRTVKESWVRDMPARPLFTEEMVWIRDLTQVVEEKGESRRIYFHLGGLTRFSEHIRIVKGRLYSAQVVDGVMEVVATAAALKSAGMVLDHIYPIYTAALPDASASPIGLRVVGIYEASNDRDAYWYPSADPLQEPLMTDPGVLSGLTSLDSSLRISKQLVFSAFDYHDFRIRDVATLSRVDREGAEFAAANHQTTTFQTTFQTVAAGYDERERQLLVMLQILFTPIFLLLVLYLFMISQMMTRGEASTVSLLESRGATRTRILSIFAIESLCLSLLTLVAGPPLALWMVRVIGASNGFLQFVDRKQLQVGLDLQAWLYCAAAAGIFFLTTMVPVFRQARVSIVQQKRRTSRRTAHPFWEKFFVDLVLLVVGLYGRRLLGGELGRQPTNGSDAVPAPDFLLFLASTAFLLGAALLFLRLYPFVLSAVHRIGRQHWGPALHASFHRISQPDGSMQFLMVFLILSLSVGLFSANAARTINRNLEDNLREEEGSDIRLAEFWPAFDEGRYVEPDLSRFLDLPGVEAATRVLTRDGVRIGRVGESTDSVRMMAIDPYGFGRVAWTRSDVNPHRLNEYMNLMMAMPEAVLLSSDLQDSLGIAIGDSITYRLDTNEEVEGIVVAFLESWPTFDAKSMGMDGTVAQQSLLVASLDSLLAKASIRPYEVWLKKSPGVTDPSIHEGIRTAGIQLLSMSSTTSRITSLKNSPILQGANGALSLGFLVSLLICSIGFLLYWFLSVRERRLQFGVFRAMGLGMSSILGMLASEQAMVSGAAIFAGFLIGDLGSLLFIPLFQLSFQSVDQHIPFRVISAPGDTAKIGIVAAMLLVAGLVVLVLAIHRIRIASAVKMGEE